MSKKTLHSVAVPATCVYVKVLSLIRNSDNHFEHGANALDICHSLCFNLLDPEKLHSKVVRLRRSIFLKAKCILEYSRKCLERRFDLTLLSIHLVATWEI